jgi:tRNA dimethylallyltransferase
MKKKLISIVGPTGIGKTALAIELAQHFNTEIISADSRQFFHELNIGVARPTDIELATALHHFIAHRSIEQEYSAGMFAKDARTKIDELHQSNDVVIMVGGSGMYISKLVEGISEIPEIEEELRKEAVALYEKIGHTEFQKKLIDLGEEKIPDKHRLIRAYEILAKTGKSISFWQKQPVKKILKDEDFVHVNLNPERKKLYENCNLRFEKMLELGDNISLGTILKKNINILLGYEDILLASSKNEKRKTKSIKVGQRS